MSKIHENNDEDDNYNSNYQSNLIDDSISSTLTDSLNTEIQNLNTSLTAVKTDTAEIKGMISTLLNK